MKRKQAKKKNNKTPLTLTDWLPQKKPTKEFSVCCLHRYRHTQGKEMYVLIPLIY